MTPEHIYLIRDILLIIPLNRGIDNIALVFVCLPSGSTDVTPSPTPQPSGIPILSPVLFMHVGDPFIPLFKFEDFLIYLLQVYKYKNEVGCRRAKNCRYKKALRGVRACNNLPQPPKTKM